ncbi:putative molybdopterin dinucleotide-binding region, partial [Vibrio parahaemolyticus V-223/04]
KFRQKTLRGPA